MKHSLLAAILIVSFVSAPLARAEGTSVVTRSDVVAQQAKRVKELLGEMRRLEKAIASAEREITDGEIYRSVQVAGISVSALAALAGAHGAFTVRAVTSEASWAEVLSVRGLHGRMLVGGIAAAVAFYFGTRHDADRVRVKEAEAKKLQAQMEAAITRLDEINLAYEELLAD